MLTQSLVSVVFEAEQPIETPVAVKVNDEGKLVLCDEVDKFIGIAIPGMEPDVTTLRTKASTGPLVVVHKGVTKVAVKAGAYKKGMKLTVDTTTGMLKAAGNTDTVVALALEDATAQDGDVLTVFII